MRFVEVPDGEFSGAAAAARIAVKCRGPAKLAAILADLAREGAAHAAAQGESGVATFATERQSNRAGSGALPRCYLPAASPARSLTESRVAWRGAESVVRHGSGGAASKNYECCTNA